MGSRLTVKKINLTKTDIIDLARIFIIIAFFMNCLLFLGLFTDKITHPPFVVPTTDELIRTITSSFEVSTIVFAMGMVYGVGGIYLPIFHKKLKSYKNKLIEIRNDLLSIKNLKTEISSLRQELGTLHNTKACLAIQSILEEYRDANPMPTQTKDDYLENMCRLVLDQNRALKQEVQQLYSMNASLVKRVKDLEAK